MPSTASIRPPAAIPGVLLAALRAGRFAPGSRLPAERTLAELLEVSRATLVIELTELERRGLIRRVSDRIRIVGDVTRPTPTAGPTRVAIGIAVLSDIAPERAGRRIFFGEHLALAVVQRLVKVAIGFSVLPVTSNEDWDGLLAQRPTAWLIIGDALALMPADVRAAFLAGSTGVPVVAFADAMPVAEIADCPADLAFTDQRSGQDQVVERLHAAGARAVLRLTPGPWSGEQQWQAERDAGYAQACVRLGLDVLPMMSVPQPGAADPQQMFQLVVRGIAGSLVEAAQSTGGFDAISCIDDGLVPPAAAACRLLRLDENLCERIAGFDGFWGDQVQETQWNKTVPLMSIDRQPELVADALVRTILGRLTNPDLPPQRVTVPVRVVNHDELAARRTGITT